jgi:hypothetical protein
LGKTWFAGGGEGDGMGIVERDECIFWITLSFLEQLSMAVRANGGTVSDELVARSKLHETKGRKRAQLDYAECILDEFAGYDHQ